MQNALRAQLLRQLRLHRPIDPIEAQALGDVLDFTETHPSPFDRQAFAPGHITASVLLLSPDGTQLGLIQHQKLGRLLQPGGHVESSDDSVLAAALRELTEETGVQSGEVEVLSEAPIDMDVHTIPAGPDEGAHCHFDLRYGVRLRSLRPLPQVTWLPLADLPDANLRRAARKLARLLPAAV
ncbi:NUDIX hydrolase [Deinococcus peraridilitoris]|uniref:NTP pyrophosphohydrolase n=1 Tax=Deinococcus peraridilitoris (strain DSM 19664 / LMG 22246 / CIP 109416 / KR-200) TaxID=937777 RepID=L0A0Y0_DEIPD|nr:NUDIX domain-containing protein [Deinococcus peraridilitoris]AFZ67506.1 NTP pyrophosphohydrolase [Deinococcus peraridilitoris DSM 19664]